MDIEEIASELDEKGNPINLVYAFNASGKTRLSVAYKNRTKDEGGLHAGVYYNAYSEDLFVWENDEENDNREPFLRVLPSSLNQFHSFLQEDESRLRDKCNFYGCRYNFKLNPHGDVERGIESVSFFADEETAQPIKISRSEEHIFVWCFFLALLEVGGWSDVQNKHIFIDDPVSSLDDSNIFLTASSVFKLIEGSFESKRIFVTTHHFGFFSILADRLTRGSKSDKYKNNTGIFVLSRNGNDVKLEDASKGTFMFHLQLLKLLTQAQKEQVYGYHMGLLRQLLEHISSFLGSSSVGRVLGLIGIEDTETAVSTIHGLAHRSNYNYHSNIMPPDAKATFDEVLAKLLQKFPFKY